jgi:hypothetical protein
MGQQPLSIFNTPFLVTGWAKLPAFTGESQKILKTTFFTANPGKTKVKITAIQVLINHSHDICPPEAVPGSIPVIPCSFQRFEMIFNTFIIGACLDQRGKPGQVRAAWR